METNSPQGFGDASLHPFDDPHCWHFNHCGRCGSPQTITPMDNQRPKMLCLDCGLYFDLRNFVRLN